MSNEAEKAKGLKDNEVGQSVVDPVVIKSASEWQKAENELPKPATEVWIYDSWEGKVKEAWIFDKYWEVVDGKMYSIEGPDGKKRITHWAEKYKPEPPTVL